MSNNLLHRTNVVRLIALAAATAAIGQAQPDPNYRIHEWTRPRPPVVDPGTPGTLEKPGKPPADATVLFGGSDLSAWCSLDGSPPKWIVKDGAMECVEGSGYLRTLQNFGDCQLHIEWATPDPPQGESQGRGNSGVFLMGLYEVQVLDSYENKTYADGQAGAVYAQYPPLVNASRPPGQWQSYDIIFAAPRFHEDGQLASPARMTVLQNGVLVQNNVTLTGPTAWMSRHPYQPHPGKLPLSLQDHGNPVRYRNIWVRELAHPDRPEFTYSTNLLDRYVGTYRVDDNLSIAVSRQGQQLHMQVGLPEQQRSFTLFAESPARFFSKKVDTSLEFRTNAQGVAESLIFSVGGTPRPARKIR